MPENAVFQCFLSPRPPFLKKLNCDTVFVFPMKKNIRKKNKKWGKTILSHLDFQKCIF